MTKFEWPPVTLDVIELSRGWHKSAANGMGTMEAVAWLAGEKHSDHPGCACPVIAAYVRPISDWASYYQRQALREFLPRLIGSRSQEYLRPRAEYLARQAVTVFLPLMYEELQQCEVAAELRAMPADTTMIDLRHKVRNANRRVICAAAAGTYVAGVRAAIAAGDAAAFADFAIYPAFAAYFAPVNDVAANAYIAAAARSAAYTAAARSAASSAAYAAAAAVAACKTTSPSATRSARNVDRQKFWQAALEALDGALAIGPAGPATLTPDMIERLKAYWTLHQTSA